MALSTGTKIVVGLTVLGAVAGMVVFDPGEGVLEYLYVEQVTAKKADDPDHFSGRTIKVHGVVAEGSVKKSKKTGDYRFSVHHGGESLNVHFTNIPPDTFQEGGEVVLTGRFDPAGQTFVSDEMSAKCPSKYENETKVEGGADPLPRKT